MPAVKKGSKTSKKAPARTSTRKRKSSDRHTTLSVENSYGTFKLRAGSIVSQVALIGLIGWAIHSFSTNWSYKTQVTTAGQLMQNIDMASMRAVRAVEQTFAQQHRRPGARLSAQHRTRAKQLAVQHLKAAMGPKGIQALQKAVGGNVEDLLEGTIEAALYKLRHHRFVDKAEASANSTTQ